MRLYNKRDISYNTKHHYVNRNFFSALIAANNFPLCLLCAWYRQAFFSANKTFDQQMINVVEKLGVWGFLRSFTNNSEHGNKNVVQEKSCNVFISIFKFVVTKNDRNTL